MTSSLTILRPDDWHLHLRDGAVLRAVLPETTRHFSRALVMPNLLPPVTTLEHAKSYLQRILSARPEGSNFTPLMTLYLTHDTDAQDVKRAYASGLVSAVKLYPAGATTNSASGVTNINNASQVFEVMSEIGMPLCVHGEVTAPDIDIFDREAVFIDQVLAPLTRKFPELKIVLEHVTTKEGVDFVKDSRRNLAATITTHHLILNRNDIFKGGIRPHYYCLPIAKRTHHQSALRAAATSGDPQFFLGTDSAPHIDAAKQSACGCAGIFSASNTMACLAQVFEDENALPKLEAFTSLNGPAFYGLAPNTTTLTLTKGPAISPINHIVTDDGPITVFDPGFPLCWHVSS